MKISRVQLFKTPEVVILDHRGSRYHEAGARGSNGSKWEVGFTKGQMDRH